jgi:hypothetical protein
MSSRAEAATGASEDCHLQLFRVPELGPGLGEHLPHLGIERVESLGPVHAHNQDLPIAFRFDDSHVIPSPVARRGREPLEAEISASCQLAKARLKVVGISVRRRRSYCYFACTTAIALSSQPHHSIGVRARTPELSRYAPITRVFPPSPFGVIKRGVD